MKTLKVLCLISLFLVCGFSNGQATQAESQKPSEKPLPGPTADEIAKTAFGQAFVGMTQGSAELRMVITNAQGEKKERSLSFKARRASDGLLQYLIRFLKPQEIKGTSFLVRERKESLPAQYVYLPAKKSVQPIAAGNASSSFFGSDFIYADLLPYPAEKKDEVTLKRLIDAKVGGQDCYMLEISPKTAESPYSRLLVSVQKKEMLPVQIDFFDQQGRAAKVMKVKKLQRVEKKLVPVELEMKSLLAGTKTEIFVDKIDPKAKLGENDFTEAAMQR